MSPWERLAALAEVEVQLARDGRWEELPAALEARAAAAAELPEPPSRERLALARLAAAHNELLGLLKSGRAETAAELARLRRGRSAVRGYAATSP